MKIGDYCRLLQSISEYSVIDKNTIYQIRDLTDYHLSLVGVGEERWIKGVGMTCTQYFPRMYFEKVEKNKD